MEWFINASLIVLGVFIAIENGIGSWILNRVSNRILGSDKGILKAQRYSEQLQKEALDKGAIW